MFCAAVFQTTCTTTGIRAIPAKRCWRATYSVVAFSSADRAAAYSGELDSSRRCTSITPHCRLVGWSVRPPVSDPGPLIPAPPAPAPPLIPAPPAWPPPLIPAPPAWPPPLMPPGISPDPPELGVPAMPVIGIRPVSPGLPFVACASPGIRWSSSWCLSALPLAFLGISPPSSGGEQAGRNHDAIPDRKLFPRPTPRSRTEYPPSRAEQRAPKSLLSVHLPPITARAQPFAPRVCNFPSKRTTRSKSCLKAQADEGLISGVGGGRGWPRARRFRRGRGGRDTRRGGGLPRRRRRALPTPARRWGRRDGLRCRRRTGWRRTCRRAGTTPAWSC